ncbi:MAG: Na+/H+ antiporter [Rhizomicrobium sp.]
MLPAPVLALLVAITVGIMLLAGRLRLPSSVLLVASGVALAFVPGLPEVRLDPQIVLTILLPPLIYATALNVSWRDFRQNLRPIVQLAFGGVVVTALATAAAAHVLLGLPWSVGFVLGAIVSPPDALAPLTILRRANLPRRLAVIIEGEGLANDATALLLYRIAIAAFGASAFSPVDAATSFVTIIAGEIGWGLAVGWVLLRVRRWAHDPQVELLLSILTPFLAYLPPESLGGSGVLATVVVGLYASWNRPLLVSAATRLQSTFFWNFFNDAIASLLFLTTGLQVRTLLAGNVARSTVQLIMAAAVVSVVIVVIRFVWVFFCTYAPRLFSARTRNNPAPPWQWPFAVAFTGVRGVVSLAAALAIPLNTASGAPFPDRDLLLFLTFAVIVVTLVGQGLLLPFIARVPSLHDGGEHEHALDRQAETSLRLAAIHASTTLLKSIDVRADVASSLHERQADRLSRIREANNRELALHDAVELCMLACERDAINESYRAGVLHDESRRRIERELDLRETAIRNYIDEELTARFIQKRAFFLHHRVPGLRILNAPISRRKRKRRSTCRLS